jgi:uncharacterized membrane protein
VHFPIACWTLGAGVDLVVLASLSVQVPGIELSALSALLLWAGTAFSIPTVVAGVVDYLRLPTAVQEAGTINRHLISMGSGWCLFLLAGVARAQSGPFVAAAPWWVVLVELAGVACLIIGGMAAAKVVFEQLPASRGAGSAK